MLTKNNLYILGLLLLGLIAFNVNLHADEFDISASEIIIDKENNTIVGKGSVEVVDKESRDNIRLNHTSTHLLHSALKQIIGEHVQQAGSLVGPKKLRFDLTHYEKINEKQIESIEDNINNIIKEDIVLDTTIESFESAKKNGAVALFGEKYDDNVRVGNIPGFS